MFKALSSLLILYLLYRSIDFSGQEFVQAWEKIRLAWLLPALPVVIVVLAIKSIRWRSVVAATGYHYRISKSVSAYLAAYSIGVVTPGRLGELLKVYNLRHDIPDIDAVTGFRTVVLDRLFDMFFLLWFGLAGVFVYFKPLGETGPYSALGISLGMMVLFLFAGLFLLRFISNKFVPENRILTFLIACMNGLTSPQSLKAWLISAVAYVVYFAGIKMLFLSLNIEIGFLETGFIISLIGLILLLPISVAGFGTREAGLVYLLSFYGISPELAVSFSLLQFATFFVWGGLVGLFFWMVSPVSLHMIRKDSGKLMVKIRGRKEK